MNWLSGERAVLVESSRVQRTIDLHLCLPETVQGLAKSSARLVQHFVHGHNPKHRHRGIRFFTPAQRHSGHDAPSVRLVSRT